jgi:hypothetical protein
MKIWKFVSSFFAIAFFASCSDVAKPDEASVLDKIGGRAMKRLFLFFCLVVLCSCGDDGYCDCDPPPRSMEFSKNYSSFNMQEGADEILALDGAYWWFMPLLGGNFLSGYYRSMQDCEYIEPAKEPDYCDNNYCDEDKNHPMKVECPWFSVTKTNDSAMLVSVKQNDTGKKRTGYTSAMGILPGIDGTYFKEFTIIQCPEPIFSKEELSFSAEGGIDNITISNNKDIKLEPKINMVGPSYYYDPIRIEGSWFTINMPDKNKIIVSVNKNETKLKRNFAIVFKNLCEEIEVTQSAE